MTPIDLQVVDETWTHVWRGSRDKISPRVWNQVDDEVNSTESYASWLDFRDVVCDQIREDWRWTLY